MLTRHESRYCENIRERDEKLRDFLNHNALTSPPDPGQWYKYLAEIKAILGNFNNGISFIATLLAKHYLATRFGVRHFDAAEKPQGAPGPDIEASTSDGKQIIAEIKTTSPYQVRDFGSSQKREFQKDFDKLNSSPAQHRFMFVTEQSTFEILCTPKYASKIRGVRIVNLITNEEYEA